MRQGLYDNLSKNCKDIIKQYSPENSIDIISNMKLPGNSNKIGKDSALKIYNLYSDESVEYKSSEYKNNITKYKKKVRNNVNISEKYCKK